MPTLVVAQHTDPLRYWQGGNYELNLSYSALRDRAWNEVLAAIWNHPLISGPFAQRYSPSGGVNLPIGVQVPPPTATVIQHGHLRLGDQVVGCDIQATRSLFECVSLFVPVGMFAGMEGGLHVRRRHPELNSLDALFHEIALHAYDVVPFDIAVIGYERGCQLLTELSTDGEARHNLLIGGNFMARGEVLRQIEPDLVGYQQPRPDLYWLPPR